MIMNDTDARLYALLEERGVEPTLNRLLVLAALDDSRHPLTAKKMLDDILASHKVNRVTVYRILDLLVEKGVINRVSTGERAVSYCVRDSGWVHGHSHFHCTSCGKVQCIDNHTLKIDEDALLEKLPMRVSNIDLRFDGICEACSR